MSKFKTYDSYSQAVSSEKVILAHLEAVRRLFNFEYHALGGDSFVYKKQVPNFVVAVENGTTELAMTSVASPELVTDDTQYHYDISTSTLYISDYSHQESEIIVTYRYFFSNAAINLPWDLKDDSPEVSYEPRINTYPNFVSQYSQGKKGLALTGSGSLKIENNDGFLNQTFDTLIWENRPARIYSTHRDLLPSQAKLIFRGIVDGKAFNNTTISFSMKDEIFALGELIPLEVYGDEVRDEDKENVKRWIYGKADNVRMQSTSQVGAGYLLTPPPIDQNELQASLYGVRNEKGVVGVNTFFLRDLTPGDTIQISTNSAEDVRVDQVVSDTYFTCDDLPFTFNAKMDALVTPDKGYYNKNRDFQLCSHALKQVLTTVTEGISPNRLKVASTVDMYANDFIEVNGNERQIRRITTDNLIILKTNLPAVPIIGQSVTKEPLRNFRFLTGGTEKRLLANFVNYTNTVNGVRVSISQNAEILSTPMKTMKELATFIPGRRTVWLGAPTLIDVQCVSASWSGTNNSLWGKYFIMFDDAQPTPRKIAIWFGDNYEIPIVNEPATVTAIGNENGGKVQKIELGPQSYTVDEIARLAAKAITDAASIFEVEFATNGKLLLASKKDVAINNGQPGNSGFAFTLQSTGINYNNQYNFKDLLKSRDWIRDSESPTGTEYEILDVAEKRITLRKPWSGSNKVDYMDYRAVDYIQDDTQVYVDVLGGKTTDGTVNGPLIDTHSKIVMDLVSAVGLGQYIDAPSFESAHVRNPYMPSLLLPLDFDGKAPAAKAVVDICNKSVLGSLHLTDALTLGYDIFDGYINNYVFINEDDSVSWASDDDAFDISRTTNIQYSFKDVNPADGNQSYNILSYESEFARKYVKSKFTEQKVYQLYEVTDAQEVVERDQLINSMSSSIIKIKGSMRYQNVPIGARVVLNLTNFYIPYGSNNSNLRAGIITKKTVTGEKVDLEVADLGAVVLRTAKITDDEDDSWQDSEEDLHPTRGYIVDDNGIVEEDEYMVGTQLIS